MEVAAPVILPLFAMAADECPDVGKSMPDTPAEIAPLLVMPPVKVETPIARIPLPPADSVPLLTIPPKRTSRLGLDRYLCAYYSLLAAVTETRRLYP